MERYDWQSEQIMFLISSGTPSTQELAQGIGLRAKSSAFERLKYLRNEGLITWEKGVHRSYRLTEQGKRYVEANYGQDQDVSVN